MSDRQLLRQHEQQQRQRRRQQLQWQHDPVFISFSPFAFTPQEHMDAHESLVFFNGDAGSDSFRGDRRSVVVEVRV